MSQQPPRIVACFSAIATNGGTASVTMMPGAAYQRGGVSEASTGSTPTVPDCRDALSDDDVPPPLPPLQSTVTVKTWTDADARAAPAHGVDEVLPLARLEQGQLGLQVDAGGA